jgi:hypothetical protein
MKRLVVWSSAVALFAIGYLRWMRPARLTAVRITSLTSDTPPTASVVLTYGVGAMPARVIVDLADDGGNGGSATVDGDQMFLDVPLIGAPAHHYRVTITATYRVLGRLLTVMREFAT